MRTPGFDRLLARSTWALFGLYGPLGVAGLVVATVRHPALMGSSLRRLLTPTVHGAIAAVAIAAAFAVYPFVAAGTRLAADIQTRNAVLPSESVGTWSQAIPTKVTVEPPASVTDLRGGRPLADCVRIPAARALAHTAPMARPQDGVTTSLYLRAAPGAPEARLRFLARTDGAEAAATVGTTASWRREVLSIDGGPHRRVSVVLFNPGPEDVDACVTGVQVEPGAEPGRYVNLVSAARDLRRSGGTPLLALGATAAMLYGLVAIVAAARALSLAARLPLARLVVWLSLGLAVHLVLVAIEVLVDPGRARGLTTHPNVLGTYAGLAAVLLATAHRGPPWRTVGLVAAVLLVLASQSRLAALGLGLVLVVALGRARGRRAAWIGAALALLMVGVVVLARGLSPDWWAATGRPAIFAAAVEAWATSVRSFLFGWGGGGATIGMALAMWPDGTRYFAHAHNGLLQLVIHGGLAGAAGVVVAAVAVVRRALTVRAADAAVAGFLAVTLVADLTVVGSPVYVLVLAYVGARSAERSSYPR